MSKGLTKKAVDMLLGGATLLSEPCPYCKGVRVMKDGNALCINCGSEPEQKQIEPKSPTSDPSTVEKLEKKLSELTDELSNEKSHDKQQSILKSINLLIETIEKAKN
jgi:UPF0148 protein|tara:strand:- start:13 stop:333 length:321 start_codon:yes stop_codon:yes gene_type:complete